MVQISYISNEAWQYENKSYKNLTVQNFRNVKLRAVKDWELFCLRTTLIKTVMRLFTAASNYIHSRGYVALIMIVMSKECNLF